MEKEDLIEAIKYLLNLRQGQKVRWTISTIWAVAAVYAPPWSELLANQCRIGLARTERVVKERMTLFDVNTDTMTPQQLINPKALSAVIRRFLRAAASTSAQSHGSDELR